MNIVNAIPGEVETADGPAEKLDANKQSKVSVNSADE